jgi:hypothetical protein
MVILFNADDLFGGTFGRWGPENVVVASCADTLFRWHGAA